MSVSNTIINSGLRIGPVAVFSALAILAHPGPKCCGQSAKKDTQQAKHKRLPDGIYGVIRSDARKNDLPVDSQRQRIIKFDRNTWGNTKDSPTFLVVKTKPDVPFLLAEDPVIVNDATDFARLNCRLEQKCADRLERFSKKNIGGRAALIIEGQVVMVATIRSPLTGGNLQISSCEKGTAEELRHRLMQRKAAGRK